MMKKTNPLQALEKRLHQQTVALEKAEDALHKEVDCRREIEKAKDPEKARQKRIAEYRERFANPYSGTVRGFIDEVIEPAVTRTRLIGAFEMLRTKRQSLPKKRHGNIPL